MGGRAGNVLLPERGTGLNRDSVANVSLLVAVEKGQPDKRVGQVPRRTLERVLAGIDVVLGR